MADQKRGRSYDTPIVRAIRSDLLVQRLRKNQDLLRSLRSQHGARLRLRAERGPSPQELVQQASLAARLQDLDIIRLEAGIERREPAQWDELRVWDPGDG